MERMNAAVLGGPGRVAPGRKPIPGAGEAVIKAAITP
jgi:hypothetical protein